MKIVLFTPVLGTQSATCRVSGDNEAGYIKVRVNGHHRHVLPDPHLGVPPDRRIVFCPRLGRGYDVWTEPMWSPGDDVVFELYDDQDKMADEARTTLV